MLKPLRQHHSSPYYNTLMRVLVVISIIGFFSALSVFSSSSSASAIANLNISFAPLSSQSRADINQAKRSALVSVLVKMSGSEKVVTHPNINALLSDVNRYIESSRFVDQPTDGLKVIFDSNLLEKWLKQQRLPLWGAIRPTATLWLSVENADFDELNYRTLLGDGSLHPLVSTISELTQARGVVINLPLLDLDDLTQVSDVDVWGLFPSPIAEASLRYQSDYALAAKVFVNADMMWQLDGMIVTLGTNAMAEKVRRYRYLGLSSEQVLSEFLSFYINQIAAETAIDTSRFANNDFLSTIVEVVDIASIEDIVYARQHLEALSMVNAAQHISQQGDKARFELTLLSDQQRLIEALSRAGKLVLTSAQSTAVDLDNPNRFSNDPVDMLDDALPVLQFRWQP